MPKQILCCVCSKRCKPGNAHRRRVVNKALKKYLKKCLITDIKEDAYICSACHSIYLRSRRAKVQNMPENTSHTSSMIMSPKSIHLQIPTTPKTHIYCVICKKEGTSKTPLTVIPNAARTQAFVETGIFIESKSRCCKNHLENSHLDRNSLDIISASKQSVLFSRTDILNLLTSVRSMMKNTSRINFDVPSLLSADEYFQLTGLNKIQFYDMLSYLTSLRSTSVRSIRTCLGVFLVKLRTGLSNKILAIIFGLKQAQVQRIIQTTRTALMEEFVPKNIGFGHISHEDFCKNHITPIARTIFTVNSDQAVVVLDGTYIYIQKSGDFHFQRRSYSMHKHRPLVKVMVIVGTDGHILSILGPYFADVRNNDASITKHIFKNNTQNINEWIREEDSLIVDRGFRNAIKFLEDQNLNVEMPKYLSKGSKQHTTEEANTTRLITKVRWVVESVNGRIKQYKMLDKVVPNILIPFIGDFVQIVGAICNKYRKELADTSPESSMIADRMLQRASMSNSVLTFLEENNLLKKRSVYKDIEAANSLLINFPRLSMDQLRDITIGVYQLKQAASYTREHIDDNGEYSLMICVEDMHPSLLKIKIQSRHTSSVAHTVWIDYSHGHDLPIRGWYCTCKVGARVVGCCAHIASILWYLGLWRHSGKSFYSSNYPLTDAAEIPSSAESCSSSSDNDSDDDTDDDNDVEDETK